MTLTPESDLFNKEAYSTVTAAENFARDNRLQEPEKTILKILKDRLKDSSMLDIGVGAGRTLPYFAALVREYVGIDYSLSMIEACRNNFPDPPPHVSFKICDAADMRMFQDDSFDFILFSYNGIDVLSHEKRMQVFSEVRRVGRPGAAFAFSSHNLLGSKKMFTIQPNRKLKRFWMSIKRCVLTRLSNEPYSKLIARDWAIIKEPTHALKLSHYYIKPSAQIAQLERAGFGNIRVFDLEGAELTGEEIEKAGDSWIYYCCNMFK